MIAIKESLPTTDVIILLDMSGSMSSIAESTIRSVDSFVEEQKSVGENARLSIVMFNGSIKKYITNTPIRKVTSIRDGYIPNGTTLLRDSLVRTIREEEKTCGDNSVIMVIVTDGEDTASTKYKASYVKELVEEKQSSGWAFIFLGANIDAFTEGNNIGVHNQMISAFDFSDDGIKRAFSASSDTVRRFRSDVHRGMTGDTPAIATPGLTDTTGGRILYTSTVTTDSYINNATTTARLTH
jgi:uncharacterized protein YegL